MEAMEYKGVIPLLSKARISIEDLIEAIPMLSMPLPDEAIEIDKSRGSFVLYGYSGNWVRFRLDSILGPAHWRLVITERIETIVKRGDQSLYQYLVRGQLQVGNWINGDFEPIWYTEGEGLGLLKAPIDAYRAAVTSLLKITARDLGVGLDAYMGLVEVRVKEKQIRPPHEERYFEDLGDNAQYPPLHGTPLRTSQQSTQNGRQQPNTGSYPQTANPTQKHRPQNPTQTKPTQLTVSPIPNDDTNQTSTSTPAWGASFDGVGEDSTALPPTVEVGEGAPPQYDVVIEEAAVDNDTVEKIRNLADMIALDPRFTDKFIDTGDVIRKAILHVAKKTEGGKWLNYASHGLEQLPTQMLAEVQNLLIKTFATDTASTKTSTSDEDELV